MVEILQYSFDYVGKSIWSVDGASEFEEFTPDVSVEGRVFGFLEFDLCEIAVTELL